MNKNFIVYKIHKRPKTGVRVFQFSFLCTFLSMSRKSFFRGAIVLFVQFYLFFSTKFPIFMWKQSCTEILKYLERCSFLILLQVWNYLNILGILYKFDGCQWFIVVVAPCKKLSQKFWFKCQATSQAFPDITSTSC